MAFVNQYPGTCHARHCRKSIPANGGLRTKVDGRWVCWCRECCPERAVSSVRPPERTELTADGHLYMPYTLFQANEDLVRAIPGARWDGATKSRTVSLDMGDRMRLLEICDQLKIQVHPSLQVQVTEQVRDASSAGLYPFQVIGVQFLSNKRKALLADDMGLGKTVQILKALLPKGRHLAIVPKGLKYNWLDEAKRWRPDLTATVLDDGFRWPEPNELLIVHYEQLPDNLLLPPKRGKREAWAVYEPKLTEFRRLLVTANPVMKEVTVVVDEAHRVKSPDAKRSLKVREICAQAERVYAATGTPLFNRQEDLYWMLDNLTMQYEVFGGWRNYCRLFNATKTGYNGSLEWGMPTPEVPERLRRVMLRRKREEVLPDLPKKTYTTMVVPLEGMEGKRIKKILDDLDADFGTMVEVGDRLPPFSSFSEVREKIARSRIPAMLEYVEECEEQEVPLIVASAHLAPMDALIGRDGWAVITGDTPAKDRQDIVRAFQSGHLKGVGLTIQAGGVGLTLTRAWKLLAVDMDWVPSNNAQVEDRICRIGQKADKVEIIRMVSDHPLDKHVHWLLVWKQSLIEQAVEQRFAAVPRKPVMTVTTATGESAEQYEERMKRFREAAEAFEREQEGKKAEQDRIRGKEKAPIILERERSKAADSGRVVLPLTPERIDVVRRAFRFMLGVCDGAVQRDGQGFNKPDAVVAHLLLSAGLETDTEVEASFLMLTRYNRQLKKDYPLLFGEKK